MMRVCSTVGLFGLTFSGGDAAAILAQVSASSIGGPKQVITANIDHIITLSRNGEFRRAYTGAAALTLDGMPLVLLARLRGARHAVRITGHDLLAAAFVAPGLAKERVFMVCASELAGRELQVKLAANGLTPDRIAFAAPPFGFEHDAAVSAALADRIRAHGTTLLLMGVGAPKSEIWVQRQGLRLGSPVVLDVGEALNVAAGLVPRAPKFMQRFALEWLFRFATDPRRLFKRYFIQSWRFLSLAARNPDLSSPLAPSELRPDAVSARDRPSPPA